MINTFYCTYILYLPCLPKLIKSALLSQERLDPLVQTVAATIPTQRSDRKRNKTTVSTTPSSLGFLLWGLCEKATWYQSVLWQFKSFYKGLSIGRDVMLHSVIEENDALTILRKSSDSFFNSFQFKVELHLYGRIVRFSCCADLCLLSHTSYTSFCAMHDGLCVVSDHCGSKLSTTHCGIFWQHYIAVSYFTLYNRTTLQNGTHPLWCTI